MKQQQSTHMSKFVVPCLLVLSACAVFQPAKTVDDAGLLLCELHVLENQEKLGELAETFCDNEETVRKFAEKARAIVEVLRE